jgi:hypothetical protein
MWVHLFAILGVAVMAAVWGAISIADGRGGRHEGCGGGGSCSGGGGTCSTTGQACTGDGGH